jgi:hypothetical protein
MSDCIETKLASPLLNTDHEFIDFTINYFEHKSNVLPNLVRKYMDFFNADYTNINIYLTSVNWYLAFSNCIHIEDMWRVFIFHLNYCFNKFVPIRFIKRKVKHKVPKTIKKLLAKKSRLWKLYKKSKDLSVKKRFKKISRLCHIKCNLFRQRSIHNLSESKNIKSFYKFVNSSLGRKNNENISIKKENSSEVLSIKTTCEKFALYFKSTFTEDNGCEPTFLPDVTINSYLDDISFEMSDVIVAINGLSNSMSQGPDLISSKFLKQIVFSISLPL